MIAFLVLAAVLVLVALAVLLKSVLGKETGPGMARALRSENIAIAREQLAALDLSRDTGGLSDTDYAEERLRIEATLSRELEHDGNDRESRFANAALGIVIALGIPLGAGWLYLQTGNLNALDRPPPAVAAAGSAVGATTSGQASETGGDPEAGQAPIAATDGADPAPPAGAPALADLVPRLEERLSEQPDDVMGWRLLGRTFIGMEQFERALRPLERAIELEPDDAGTHTQLAEARAMTAGGDLNGAALQPLERAYALDPQHEQTLWLLGVARQQANRHAEAIELLSTLRGIAETAGNTEALATLDDYLATSRQALGVEAPAETPGADRTETALPGVSAALTIDVALGDRAQRASDASLTVFVYARAAEGPPMPLAVQRLTVADLPTSVTLDESMAMMPNLTLAAFPDVVVGARISNSGQPTPSSGDWSVERAATVGQDGTADEPLVLTIEDRLP